MVVEASITGLFKTIFIIIGVVVFFRFIGRLMIVKRQMEAERKMNAESNKTQKERAQKLKNFGKVSVISKEDKRKPNYSKVEDVNYEEFRD
jgi:ABC-type transport system involved in Fe-S cluster assembly fused permease/ATPase subunit